MATTPLTYALLIASYPEFTTTVTDQQTTIGTLCAVADERCVASMYATTVQYEQARRALAAHLVKLVVHRTQNHGGSGVGAISGRMFDGGKSVTYNKVQTWLEDDWLTSTPYGLVYMTLKRGSLARLPLIV